MNVKKFQFGSIVVFIIFLTILSHSDLRMGAHTVNSNFKIQSSSVNETVDYLIVTTQEYMDELKPLALWKTQKGLTSRIVTVETIDSEYSGRDTPEKIKNCIDDFYNHNNTQWVLLAGDYEDVPSRLARIYDNFTYTYDDDFVRCDSYYADLDNNWDLNGDSVWGTELDEWDMHPEVYIGRLTAKTELEMTDLVDRILKYEITPPLGDWMNHALFAGAMIAFEEDWDDDGLSDFDELDANRVHNFLIDTRIPKTWTTTLLGEDRGIKNSSYTYDYPLNTIKLESEINNNPPTVCSITGHGNPFRMVQMYWLNDYDSDGLFDYSGNPSNGATAVDYKEYDNIIDTETANLNPSDEKFGVYYLGGCSTGTFDLGEDSLAELFLKTAAIACIAGSNTVWGEDSWTERERGGWYSEGLAARFWEFFFLFNQPGKALALAKENYTLDRIASGVPPIEPVWEEKTLKQFNLFGDPEIPIWINIPKILNLNEIDSTDEISRYNLTSENELIKNGIITLTQGDSLLWSGYTDIEGIIEIPISILGNSNIVITASKSGFIPYQSALNSRPSIPGFEVWLISTFGLISAIFYVLKIQRSNKKRSNC